MKWDSIVSLAVSAAAAFGTLYVYIVHTRKLNLQQKQINEYQIKKSKEEEDKKKKAIIEANIYKTDAKGPSWRMKICNKGQTKARNISYSAPDIGDYPKKYEHKTRKNMIFQYDHAGNSQLQAK